VPDSWALRNTPKLLLYKRFSTIHLDRDQSIDSTIAVGCVRVPPAQLAINILAREKLYVGATYNSILFLRFIQRLFIQAVEPKDAGYVGFKLRSKIWAAAKAGSSSENFLMQV
jgi:hypothetical protein